MPTEHQLKKFRQYARRQQLEGMWVKLGIDLTRAFENSVVVMQKASRDISEAFSGIDVELLTALQEDDDD